MRNPSSPVDLSVVRRRSRGAEEDGRQVGEQPHEHRDRARGSMAEESHAEAEAEAQSKSVTERRIKVGTRAASATRGRSQRPQAIDPRLIPFRDAMADLLVEWVLKQPEFAHLRRDREVG